MFGSNVNNTGLCKMTQLKTVMQRFSLLLKTVKSAALLDVHLANLRSRFKDSTGNKILLVITPGTCI